MKADAIYWINRAMQWIIDTVFVTGFIALTIIFTGVKIEFDPAKLALADKYLATEKAVRPAQISANK